MNIPKGYKLVPINPTAEMIEAAFVGKVEAQSVQHQQRARDAMGRDYQAIVAATPEPPAFDGEPSVIAFASFATNGNLRCWSSDCEAVGLKVIAEGGGPITALIDRDHLRFHARVSEQVEAHLSQQIDILTIDLNAARARIDRMVEALEKTLTLRGTLELHGILGQVEQAIGPRYETATELDELFKPGNGNAARRRADGVSKGCDQPQAQPARCGCEGKANG